MPLWAALVRLIRTLHGNMDYPAEEEIVETKGFLRHPLLAIAVWMLGGNNDSSNKT